MRPIVTSYGPQGLSRLPIELPSSASREAAYDAIQAHYEAQYGPHVVISVEHLCSSPDDDELGTVRHSAAVEARCEHGLSMRICTVGVVTQGSKP